MSSNTVRASASPPFARRRDHPSLQRRVAATDLFVRSPALFMRGMSTRPRGAIVDEDASSTRSAKGALGPAIDVFEVEPLPPEHAVRRLDNVVATPHIRYVSRDFYRVRRPVANIADRLRRDPERRHLRGGQLGCAAKQKFAWVSTGGPPRVRSWPYLLRRDVARSTSKPPTQLPTHFPFRMRLSDRPNDRSTPRGMLRDDIRASANVASRGPDPNRSGIPGSLQSQSLRATALGSRTGKRQFPRTTSPGANAVTRMPRACS